MAKEVKSNSRYNLKIAYVSFAQCHGGKHRPVLIRRNLTRTFIWKITSQYANKSKNIRQNYFKINNWKACGLRKVSYVDNNDVLWMYTVNYDKTHLAGRHIIGHLYDKDVIRFTNFILFHKMNKIDINGI